MRVVAPIFLEPSKLDAIAASLHANLLAFIAWLVERLAFAAFAEGSRRDLDRRLRAAAIIVERIIFLHAAWRLRRWKPAVQRYSEGRGPNYRFRRTSAGVVRRLMRIPGLQRGSLRARAQRLAAILAAPERWIVRRVRHLQRRRHGGFAPVASHQRLTLPAESACVRGADTS